MTFVMRILGTSYALIEGSGAVYLEHYDPATAQNSRDVRLTMDRTKAKRFATVQEGLELWRTPSIGVPLRQDRKPNRPLSAYTFTMEDDKEQR